MKNDCDDVHTVQQPAVINPQHETSTEMDVEADEEENGRKSIPTTKLQSETSPTQMTRKERSAILNFRIRNTPLPKFSGSGSDTRSDGIYILYHFNV